MKRLGWWMPLLTTAAITWQEAAENPVVFCYRMGWGVYLGWRSPGISSNYDYED